MDKRILVVDDTKNIRMMISKCLSSEGYMIDNADNGYDAISLFKENKYDIVILDIRMPQLSGTDVLRAIKEIDRDVSVVIITAFPTIKNAVECTKMGAIDYLRKPFTPDKIKGIVKSIIERENISSGDVGSYESAVQYAKKCISAGKFDEGIQYLKKSISITVDDAEPFLLLGNIYESMGDLTSAGKYYKIALQLAPGSEQVIESLNRIEKTTVKDS